MTTAAEHPDRAPGAPTAPLPTVPAIVVGTPPAPGVWEARDARDALALSLAVAGIELPAMDIRTPWAGSEEARPALVHLGVCSPAVALALAEVIRKGTTP